MAHAFHEFQFDQLVCDQSQAPALVSFRRLATQQCDQMRFLLAIQLAFLVSRRLWAAIERGLQAPLHKAAAHPMHGRFAHLEGLMDLPRRPAGSVWPTVGFEQDTRMGELARWGLPSADQGCEVPTLLLRQ